MTIASFAQWTDTAARLATIFATIVLGLWAYSRYLAQQIVRPPIEFTVEGAPIAELAGKCLLRITFRVHNGGTRECDTWLSWRLLGLRESDQTLAGRGDARSLEQVRFPRIYPPKQPDERRPTPAERAEASRREAEASARNPERPRAGFLPVVISDEDASRSYTTFVGAGVTQEYTIVPAVDLDLVVVKVQGNINYRRSRSGLSRKVTGFTRRVSGLSKREVRETTIHHTIDAVVVIRAPQSST